MATEQFRGNGAFSVNEGYATSVRYAVELDGQGARKVVELRFMNGRSEIASARLSPDVARDVMGDRNFDAMLKGNRAYAAAMEGREAGEAQSVRLPERELRGRNLEFRQVMLPGYGLAAEENAIHLDSRVRANSADAERLTARDVVVGSAHTAQAVGLGGPAMHGVAAAVGVADAAKLTVDAIEGKPVRPLDAATAAATVAVSSGMGGPAVQAAARVTQAVGAVDTAKRATASLDATAGDAEERESATDDEARKRRQRLRSLAVPDAVADRFLKVDDKYFFPDKKLAFVDRGTKLKAESNNLEVVRSIVAIAETRGWEALTVTGANEFRREVWREASLRGIDVRGYEPNNLERQELQRALDKRHGANEIQREGRQQSAETPASTVKLQQAAAARRDPKRPDAEQQGPTTLTGLLVDKGVAPYRFEATQGLSYFVKLKTEKGERVLWGVDLERALVESRTGVKVGDQVTVERQGSKPVTVAAATRDANGNVVRDKEVKTHRNGWVVEKPAYFDERTEKAAAFRNGESAKQELAARYPDLTNAIATMRLGELFAAKLIDRPEDRERVVASLRETLADAIGRGETIQAPKIREAAVRQLDKITGEIDEVAQRVTTNKAASAARDVGERVKTREDLQHVRA